VSPVFPVYYRRVVVGPVQLETLELLQSDGPKLSLAFFEGLADRYAVPQTLAKVRPRISGSCCGAGPLVVDLLIRSHCVANASHRALLVKPCWLLSAGSARSRVRCRAFENFASKPGPSPLTTRWWRLELHRVCTRLLLCAAASPLFLVTVSAFQSQKRSLRCWRQTWEVNNRACQRFRINSK
jgi:hypothetical protein